MNDIQHPLVILNAPPYHFDVINNQIHDLNDLFPKTPGNFYAEYFNDSTKTNSTSVSIDKSFGMSRELNKYVMAGGTGFENTLNQSWDFGNEYYEGTTYKQEIKQGWIARTEDMVLYSSEDYLYYRYPVWTPVNRHAGYIGVLNPTSNIKYTWGSGNSWEDPSYSFNHETGNVLSYSKYMNVEDFQNPNQVCDLNELLLMAGGNSGVFEANFSKVFENKISSEIKSGTGSNKFRKVGYEATLGLETDIDFLIAKAEFYSEIQVRMGISDELSKNYSNSKLMTNNTTFQNSFFMKGILGSFSSYYDYSGRYYVMPYIYRSQCGALVLDYTVRPDEDNYQFWDSIYVDFPDLAFILPWRYASERTDSALIEPSKKQKTNDIQFYPSIAAKGNTVCITVRVHNYSLCKFQDSIQVDLYLGDPAKGGVRLEDINGKKRISEYAIMDREEANENLDFEEYLTFLWKVPENITCSPRIYAVIDPDTLVPEIHENNNTGWNTLNIYGCDECDYSTGTDDYNNAASPDIIVYPNPYTVSTSIQVTLSAPDRVKMELYSMTGVKICDMKDQLYPAGKHSVQFDGSNLSEGIYLMKTTVGQKTRTTKIIKLH